MQQEHISLLSLQVPSRPMPEHCQTTIVGRCQERHVWRKEPWLNLGNMHTPAGLDEGRACAATLTTLIKHSQLDSQLCRHTCPCLFCMEAGGHLHWCAAAVAVRAAHPQPSCQLAHVRSCTQLCMPHNGQHDAELHTDRCAASGVSSCCGCRIVKAGAACGLATMLRAAEEK
jgi:hypothetical protein